jgi:hypothetical protein
MGLTLESLADLWYLQGMNRFDREPRDLCHI